MKISALIKLLEIRKKEFGNIEVVDDLGYITNDLAYNEEDNSFKLNILSVFSVDCGTTNIFADIFINIAAYLVKEATITFFCLAFNHLQDDF
jgi:hypothetical protein